MGTIYFGNFFKKFSLSLHFNLVECFPHFDSSIPRGTNLASCGTQFFVAILFVRVWNVLGAYANGIVLWIWVCSSAWPPVFSQHKISELSYKFFWFPTWSQIVIKKSDGDRFSKKVPSVQDCPMRNPQMRMWGFQQKSNPFISFIWLWMAASGNMFCIAIDYKNKTNMKVTEVI